MGVQRDFPGAAELHEHDVDAKALKPPLYLWQITNGCVIEINDTGTKLRYSFPQHPRRRAEFHLTQCISRMVLESQLSHNIVYLLLANSLQYNQLPIFLAS